MASAECEPPKKQQRQSKICFSLHRMKSVSIFYSKITRAMNVDDWHSISGELSCKEARNCSKPDESICRVRYVTNNYSYPRIQYPLMTYFRSIVHRPPSLLSKLDIAIVVAPWLGALERLAEPSGMKKFNNCSQPLFEHERQLNSFRIIYLLITF